MQGKSLDSSGALLTQDNVGVKTKTQTQISDLLRHAIKYFRKGKARPLAEIEAHILLCRHFISVGQAPMLIEQTRIMYEYYQPPVVTDHDFIRLVKVIADLCQECGLNRKKAFYTFIVSSLIAEKTKDFRNCLGLLKEISESSYSLPLSMIT